MAEDKSSKNLLRDFDAAFRSMFMNHSAVIYIVDLSDFSIVDANQAALDFYGYDRKSMLTKRIPDLNTTPEDEIRTEIQKSVEEGRSFYIFKHRIANGAIRDVEIYANPVTLGDREFSLSIVHDITERKLAEDELQKSNQRFQDITAQSPLPIVITGAKGDIEFFNNKFIEVFGYSLDDISTAEQWWTAVYPDLAYRQAAQESWKKAIDQAAEKGTQIEAQEWEVCCKDGSVRCVEFDMMPLGDISVIVMNDITEHKKAVTALKESNKELDAFVQTVAHDLRTPIIPIIGYAEILRESYKEQLDEQGLSYLTEIEKAGEEMLALMEDLLSLAMSGELKRPVEPVSTDEVVAGVIKNLEADISNAGVALQTDPLPSVCVPKSFLIQIFDNLIRNAVRYAGKSGGLIQVGGEQTGKQIRFFVRDHGPGISEQERKHIFEIFYRGTNRGEVKGSGVGLSIVYKIARNCGGRVWVEETQGGGCTFWVEIEEVAHA